MRSASAAHWGPCSPVVPELHSAMGPWLRRSPAPRTKGPWAVRGSEGAPNCGVDGPEGNPCRKEASGGEGG